MSSKPKSSQKDGSQILVQLNALAIYWLVSLTNLNQEQFEVNFTPIIEFTLKEGSYFEVAWFLCLGQLLEQCHQRANKILVCLIKVLLFGLYKVCQEGSPTTVIKFLLFKIRCCISNPLQSDTRLQLYINSFVSASCHSISVTDSGITLSASAIDFFISSIDWKETPLMLSLSRLNAKKFLGARSGEQTEGAPTL